MAFEEALKSVSVPASADLSASQYCFMTINSSGQLAATAAGAPADGVLQDKPSAAGMAGALGIEGVTMVKAGAAITAGDDISAGSGGVALTSTSGDEVCGRALESASGSGSIIACLLTRSAQPLA